MLLQSQGTSRDGTFVDTALCEAGPAVLQYTGMARNHCSRRLGCGGNSEPACSLSEL